LLTTTLSFGVLRSVPLGTEICAIIGAPVPKNFALVSLAHTSDLELFAILFVGNRGGGVIAATG
jgi:hypothetical protein